jgi:arylformamidase
MPGCDGAGGAPLFFSGPVLDITQPLPDSAVLYPGDPEYSRSALLDNGLGDAVTVSAVTLCLHHGTHLDAPAHFIPGGKTVDAYPPERFILPAVVADVPEGPLVLARHVPPELGPGMAALFRTDNSRAGRPSGFHKDYTALSVEAARQCLEQGAALVGVDGPGVDAFEDEGYPVHRLLLGSDVPLLENAWLTRVPPGLYLLVCLPLRLAGAEASPVRAVLAGGPVRSHTKMRSNP